jgi:hypothetical protein
LKMFTWPIIPYVLILTTEFTKQKMNAQVLPGLPALSLLPPKIWKCEGNGWESARRNQIFKPNIKEKMSQKNDAIPPPPQKKNSYYVWYAEKKWLPYTAVSWLLIASTLVSSITVAAYAGGGEITSAATTFFFQTTTTKL